YFIIYRQVWLDKMKFTLDGTIGHTYGSTFEVKNGEMVKVTRIFKEEDVLGTEQGKDNRDLHDLDSNQKLSRDDIEKLKKDGVKGKELIGHLIENSTTFKAKTEYAQEKWVKKKKLKHVAEFTVLRPCARLMCDIYSQKGPSKILHLRMDTLAQILLYGNVRAHSNVAVVDTCCGLVVGAVMERLGGYGKVIHFHPGDMPIRPVVENLNFSKDVLDSLYTFPLSCLNSVSSKTSVENKSENSDSSSNTTDTNEVKRTKTDEKTDEINQGGLEENEKNSEDLGSEEGSQCEETEGPENSTSKNTKNGSEKRKHEQNTQRVLNKQERERQIEDAKKLLQEKSIDCLIVASKFHPTPIVLALVDYMAPSRQVVVYSQFKEAVMDSYAYLRERGGLVNYRVSETWLRNYQVMTMRTHPVIQMSGGGGYLLTATTILKPS
ncbi:hypothetical protein FSP39_015098, partial [Pinctada imbricata]